MDTKHIPLSSPETPPVAHPPTLTRRMLLSSSAAGAASLLMPGCGGGSKSSGSVAGGSGTLTEAQRSTAFDAIRQQYATLPHTTLAADNTAMFTYLKTRSELRLVQITNEQTIAARFVDGPGFVFLNNLDTKGAINKSARSKAGPAMTRFTNSIPEPGAALLLNGLGVLPAGESGIVNQSLNSIYANAHLDQLVSMFKLRGYHPTKAFATISALRNVHSAALLYFIGHGGTGIDANGALINIINSSDAYNANSSDRALADDIKANYVGFAMIGDIDTNYKRVAKPAYYITPSFITNYMSFTKYSLVFINGCVGIIPAAHIDILDPKFAPAFFSPSVQASAYMSWDGLVNAGDVRDSAEYFFDRLLGANVSNVGSVKATPPNVPYDAYTILDVMQKTNRDGQGFPLSQSIDSEPNDLNRNSNLRLVVNPKDPATFGRLAPSIGLVFPQDDVKTLYINGNFGTISGSVTMAGTALKIQQWTDHQIQCDLPPTGGGDIIVTVNGISSPPHRLLEWLVPLHYRGTPTGTGDSHTELAELIFQFRGDASVGRSSINETPTSLNTVIFANGPGSSGSFSVNGQYEDTIQTDHHKIVYTGSGNFPVVTPKILTPPYMQYHGTLDFGKKMITLYFDVVANKVATDTVGVPPNTTEDDVQFHLLSSTPTGKITLSFDDQFIIQADMVSISFAAAAGIPGMPFNKQTFNWDRTAPTSGTAPDPNQSRSAAIAVTPKKSTAPTWLPRTSQ